MPKFIELHLSYYGNPIYINVDTISYFYEEDGHVYIHLTVPEISSHDSKGQIKEVVGKAEIVTVRESYSKVKSLIED